MEFQSHESAIYQVDVLKGHGFSRAANATKQFRALAPEGMLNRHRDLFNVSSDFPQPQ
jgi:hypothetical protein